MLIIPPYQTRNAVVSLSFMTAALLQKPKRPGRSLTRETFIAGIRVIGRQLKGHKSVIVLLVVLSVVDAAAQAFVPLVAGKIFDAIIALATNQFALLTPVFVLIGVWLALQMSSNIINWQVSFNNQKIGAILEAEYIAKGFGKIFEMPLSFHVSRKQGDVSDRITRAAGWLDNLVTNVAITLLPNFLSIFIALIVTLFINIKLTLLLCFAIAIYIAILWRSLPRIAGLQQRMHRAYNRAYGDAYDAMGNIREIKHAATETLEQKKVQNAFVNRAARFWYELSSIFQRLTFSQRILVTLTQLSIFAASVFLVRNGTITPGGLVAFNGYAAMIFGPFVVLGNNWQTIQNGMVAIVRAEKLLNFPTENYEPKNAVVPKKLRGEVAFENVYFSYKEQGGEEILKGISFSVKAGERVALVGESGMGKTTIIDLLSGFYFPQEGRITVDGTDIKRMNLRAYRARIGVVPQEPTLFNDTVEANLRYGNPEKSRADMVRATKEAHAADFIESFPKKYRQVVGWRGIKLSIGQKQRIALARAFLRDPDILILDEPTSALDARSEHFIKQSLRKLMEGRTTFIIAHRLSTVREVDKILVLKDGKIVEQGRHDELVKVPHGIYRSLYELQSGFGA